MSIYLALSPLPFVRNLQAGRPCARRGVTRCAAAIALLVGLLSTHAKAAERQHTVTAGQTMAGVAQRYGVTIWSLAAANQLNPEQQIRAGQVLSIPEKGAVYVNPGQTLWSVARRHRVSVDALARCNGLKPTASLRPGMRLTLPGHVGSFADERGRAAGDASTRSFDGNRSGSRRGRVQLVRVGTRQSLTLTLADRRGRVRPAVVSQLAHFLRPRHSRKTKPPQRRLIALLAQTSDHFGGRKLHVISGYRLAKGHTSRESRHVHGAAVDFRIEGVPNRVLRDYLRHFDDVGVGFYPNSSFVHFDVRDRNAYWIDTSGAGERPHYLPRAVRDHFDEAQSSTTTDEPIGDIVEAAIEEMQHDEPGEAESDDE